MGQGRCLFGHDLWNWVVPHGSLAEITRVNECYINIQTGGCLVIYKFAKFGTRTLSKFLFKVSNKRHRENKAEQSWVDSQK